MNCIECFIGLILLSVVHCHPINMVCVPACSPNITASAEMIHGWLNQNSAEGIYQLHYREDTVIYKLMEEAPTEVSQSKLSS